MLSRLGSRLGSLAPNVFSRFWLARIYVGLGAFSAGLEHAAKGLSFAKAYSASIASLFVSPQVQLHLLNDNVAEAQALVTLVEKNWHEAPALFGATLSEAEVYFALYHHQYDRLLIVCEETLAHLDHHGVNVFIPDFLFYKGQAQLGLNDPTAARQTLLAAKAHAETINSRRLLWQILALLAKAEEMLGQTAVAATYREQARAFIHYIADHTPPDLRAGFLGLPEVTAVLAAK